MNVLFLSPRFNTHSGGDGLYAWHLAHELYQQGASVSVLTVSAGRFALMSPGPGGRVEEKVLPEAIGTGWWGLNFYCAAAARALRAALAEVRPDIIHIHGLHQYFTPACVRALKSAAAPCVFTVHDYKMLCGNAGFYSDRTNRACFKCLTGRTFPAVCERCKGGSLLRSAGVTMQMTTWRASGWLESVAAFHCGSNYVHDLLRWNPRIKDRLHTIRMPLLNPGRAPGTAMGDSPLNVVYMGRMMPHKGVLIFAEAVRNLAGVRIDLFGDGPERGAAEAVLGQTSGVRFHGWVSHAVMAASLRGASTVVVVPYRAPETFCYVVLEAMTRGCCVVASPCGAIPELVKHSHNGIIVEHLDAASFRAGVQSLMDDPARRARLSTHAREVVREIDPLAQHVRKMRALYEALRR